MGQLLGRAEGWWYRLEAVSLQVQHCDGLQVAAPRKALQICTQFQSTRVASTLMVGL